jgi:hypothetical protein
MPIYNEYYTDSKSNPESRNVRLSDFSQAIGLLGSASRKPLNFEPTACSGSKLGPCDVADIVGAHGIPPIAIALGRQSRMAITANTQ